MIEAILEKWPKGKSYTQFMKAVHATVFEKYLSSALYRLPQHTTKHQIIEFEENMVAPETQLEELPSGFLLSSFDKQSAFIRNDLHLRYSEEVNIALSPTLKSTDLDESFFKKLSENLEKGSSERAILNTQDGEEHKSTSEADFLHYIEIAKQAILDRKFEKVVPARCKWIELPKDFDSIELFEKLCSEYPNAMVSLVISPSIGTWIGASPENLVTLSDKGTFRTVALAGTQAFSENKPLVEVAWTQKEIEEQAFVSRYIIDCFKKIRLREFTEKGPRTTKAGNLIHLKTEFSVDMNATNFENLGSVMLDLLHPTSAVCGMPKDSALAFINKHETFDRSFFSGYLGPVKVEDESHIFVNLRCMQLFGDKAQLFAGAGVTEDSVPQNEWKETELKLQTLMSLIFQA